MGARPILESDFSGALHIKAHLSKLFPAASEIIITDFVEISFFSLSVERIAFGMDHGIGSDNLT